MKNLLHVNSASNVNDSLRFFYVCVLALFSGGLISVLLGADINWDLMNYHLYNPTAFFHNKIETDLAPAGLQTYFNPLLDIPYYWLTKYLPAIAVGFIMGFLHAGNFILLALMARQLFPGLPQRDNNKLPFLLALCGCLTANFSSAFGNTMGDIITALLILSSLLIVLRELMSELILQKLMPWLLAGFLTGLATGLKLTNAVFAVGLCASFLFLPLPAFVRLKLIILFGVAALAGLVLTAGYWFYEMWMQFGNPLFPQFSTFFPNELTRNVTVADTRWGPHNIVDILLWPFIISFNPLRVGELKHHQIIWAAFYVVVIFWIFYFFIARKKLKPIALLTPATKYTLCFIFISFTVWTVLFSIQRYLVAIEILIPIAIFMLLKNIFPYEKAKKFTTYLLVASTLTIYIGGAKTWGHADWAKDMFAIELPVINEPEKTTVILAGGDPPLGWIAAQFPASLAFVQLEGNFPANPTAYLQRVSQIIDERKGDIFVLFQGETHSLSIGRVQRANAVLTWIGVTQSIIGCDYLQKLVQEFRLNHKVRLDVSSNGSCQLVNLKVTKPTEPSEAFYEQQIKQQLMRHGYGFDRSSCQTHNAYIGKKMFKYRWCLGKKL